jgi:hypothetical protein
VAGRILSLAEMLDANGSFIVPADWRPLGAAEVHRRAAEMRIRNLEERKDRWARLAHSPSLQREEMEACAWDLTRWCVNWGWLPNANERSVLPFLPFEAQVRELIHPFYADMVTPLDPSNPRGDDRRNIVDKPRYMGASYCILSGFLWGALFHQYWDGGAPCVFLLAADRKEHIYSKDDQETHQGRMEQILRALPEWMLPEPIGKRTFTAFKIAFPANKSMIRGKAAKGSFGRAQRARAALLDEEAHMADGTQTVTSAGDLTQCLWRISSVNGMGNSFAKDMHDHGLKIRRHRLKYTDCPWYDDAWLKSQQATRSPEAFQQEIMVNYRAQTGRAYWSPPFEEALNVVEDVELLKHSPLYMMLDVGRADGAALLWGQADYQAAQFNLLGMVYRPEANEDYLVPFMLGKFPTEDRLGSKFPAASNWHAADQEFVRYLGRLYAATGPMQFITGTDAAEQRMHADSLVTHLRRRWGLIARPVKPKDKGEAIERVRRMIPHIRIPKYAATATPGQYDRTGRTPFALPEVFYRYRRKVNQQTGEVLESGMPVHDEVSNPADCLQYWALILPLQIPRLSAFERERGLGRGLMRTEAEARLKAPSEAAQYAKLIFGKVG